jgi:hypothetical protein
MHRRQHDAVEARLRKSLEVFRASGDIGTTADIRRGLGDLEMLRDNPTAAAGHLIQALDGWNPTGAHLEVARTHARLEVVAARLDDPTAVQRHRQRWREVLDDLGLDEACLCLPAFLGSSQADSDS